MPTKENKPHEISEQDFRKNRAAAYAVAASGREVVIKDENDQPVTILVTPRDQQPMRFD